MKNKLIDAKDFHKAKKVDDALKIYKEILIDEPANISALSGAVEILSSKGDFDDAISLCEIALHNDANLTIPHVLLAYMYYEMNESERAVLEVKTALKMKPDSSEALCCYGALLYHEAQYQDAIKYLRSAVDIDGEMYVAHNYLSACYQRIGNNNKHHDELIIIRRLKPNIENTVRLIASYFENNRMLVIVAAILPIVVIFDARLNFTLLIHVPIILVYIASGLVSLKANQSRYAIGTFSRALMFILFDVFVIVTS